jgi:hypothetical protein
MNQSYKEITTTGRCIDYKMLYANKTAFWVETWQVDSIDYYAIFSDHPNATLPITITRHEFLS